MGDIKVSTADVQATAMRIKSTNTALQQTLQAVSSEIKGVNQVWQSKSSSTFAGNYDRLSRRYEEFRKAVDTYADFLLRQVQTGYEQTEQGIDKGASQFGG